MARASRAAVSRFARTQSPVAYSTDAGYVLGAERLFDALRRAQVGEHAHRRDCAADTSVNDGSAIMPASHVAVLHRRDGGRRGADRGHADGVRRQRRAAAAGRSAASATTTRRWSRRRCGPSDRRSVVTVAALCGDVDEHHPGKSQHRDERHELAPLGRHLNRVVVEAGHHVGAAADQRLQRLRRRPRNPAARRRCPLRDRTPIPAPASSAGRSICVWPPTAIRTWRAGAVVDRAHAGHDSTRTQRTPRTTSAHDQDPSFVVTAVSL